jgi:hypothetical protein
MGNKSKKETRRNFLSILGIGSASLVILLMQQIQFLNLAT